MLSNGVVVEPEVVYCTLYVFSWLYYRHSNDLFLLVFTSSDLVALRHFLLHAVSEVDDVPLHCECSLYFKVNRFLACLSINHKINKLGLVQFESIVPPNLLSEGNHVDVELCEFNGEDAERDEVECELEGGDGGIEPNIKLVATLGRSVHYHQSQYLNFGQDLSIIYPHIRHVEIEISFNLEF
jgi:hypothetical protein